jgi:hypothetical protein
MGDSDDNEARKVLEAANKELQNTISGLITTMSLTICGETSAVEFRIVRQISCSMYQKAQTFTLRRARLDLGWEKTIEE